MKIEKISRSM